MLTPEAGFQLARMIRGIVPDVPIVLQSSRTEFMQRAFDEGFGFLQKRSPTLLGDLRRMLVDEAGFGDFVFRLSDGKTEVGRASNLNELETQLATVPAESIELPRPAQPLLALADDAHRVRPGAKAAAAQGFGLRRTPSTCGATSSHPSPSIAASKPRRSSANSIRRHFSRQMLSSCRSAAARWAARRAAWLSYGTCCTSAA